MLSGREYCCLLLLEPPTKDPGRYLLYALPPRASDSCLVLDFLSPFAKMLVRADCGLIDAATIDEECA